jgi:hypothetical protein
MIKYIIIKSLSIKTILLKVLFMFYLSALISALVNFYIYTHYCFFNWD